MLFFSEQFYFEATFFSLLPSALDAYTAEVPSLQFNHAAFLLYGCAIRKAPRLASPVSLLYTSVDGYMNSFSLSLFLQQHDKIASVSLARLLYGDANLFHIMVRGNKVSPSRLFFLPSRAILSRNASARQSFEFYDYSYGSIKDHMQPFFFMYYKPLSAKNFGKKIAIFNFIKDSVCVSLHETHTWNAR